MQPKTRSNPCRSSNTRPIRSSVDAVSFSIRLQERVMLPVMRRRVALCPPSHHLNQVRSVEGDRHAAEERYIQRNRIQEHQDRNETWQAEKAGGGDRVESGTQVRRQDFKKERQVIRVSCMLESRVGRMEVWLVSRRESRRREAAATNVQQQLGKAAAVGCHSQP
jgi:hypothetical protein